MAPKAYWVIDNRTEHVMGAYTTLKRARRRADKLDLEYGAIRYRVQAVELKLPSGSSGQANVY